MCRLIKVKNKQTTTTTRQHQRMHATRQDWGKSDGHTQERVAINETKLESCEASKIQESIGRLRLMKLKDKAGTGPNTYNTNHVPHEPLQWKAWRTWHQAPAGGLVTLSKWLYSWSWISRKCRPGTRPLVFIYNIDDVNLDSLPKGVSVKILLWNCYFFPFVITKFFGKDIWYCANFLFLLKLSPINFSTHWWNLSFANIIIEV